MTFAIGHVVNQAVSAVRTETLMCPRGELMCYLSDVDPPFLAFLNLVLFCLPADWVGWK